MPFRITYATPAGAPVRRRSHPIAWTFAALVVAYFLYAVYDAHRSQTNPHPTLKDPNGEWIGQITMDGRYYQPSYQGDTLGQHRFAVVSFTLATTDSFLDHHTGSGSLRIGGENITRPIQLYNWEIDPDGTVRLGISGSPDVFHSDFACEADGNTLTCKSSDDLKSRLTLRPGSTAEADALFAQALHSEATEPPLPSLPHVETMQEFENRMHRDEEETDRELGRDTSSRKSAPRAKHGNRTP